MVAIVNKKLAEQSWPGQDPIGKRMRIGTETMQTPWALVVGEVADVKEQSPDQPSKQQYYMAAAQELAMAGELAPPGSLSGNGGFIALRNRRLPQSRWRTSCGQRCELIDPQLPLTQVQTMEHAISETEAPRRFNTALISTFAGTAVLLAVLGIYSVIAFTVALRIQEIAIRMALGSQRTGIVGLVLASGLEAGGDWLRAWIGGRCRGFEADGVVPVRRERDGSAGAGSGERSGAAAGGWGVFVAGAAGGFG